MQRQIIYNLVENDTMPPTPVRFVGLDLRDYAYIYAHIVRPNGTKFARLMSLHPHDHELAFVTWIAGDLKAGRMSVDFELRASDGTSERLPKAFSVVLSVRKAE